MQFWPSFKYFECAILVQIRSETPDQNYILTIIYRLFLHFKWRNGQSNRMFRILRAFPIDSCGFAVVSVKLAVHKIKVLSRFSYLYQSHHHADPLPLEITYAAKVMQLIKIWKSIPIYVWNAIFAGCIFASSLCTKLYFGQSIIKNNIIIKKYY